MRKSIIIIALSLVTTGFGASMAAAQSTPGVDNRENRQAKRIFHGVRNGSLTPRETGQLLRGEARIHRMENRFKSDGKVTVKERARLHRNLNRQSRRIYRKKHN